ncbi:MAG: non-heme iron oxygenase ferredoxin subunit [Candidatus Omnitrophica bacterium]|nr:non-heme iron oxygenase ferredoxin subunit [Candidatus Omnitrophota bacterium]
MAELVTVAKTSEIGAGQAKAVDVKGQTVAVFNVGGTFYAIEDTCTHVGGPLSEGEVQGTAVTCPWHGAQFDVTSGKVLGPPAAEGVKSYPVRVEGDEIKVELP